LKKKGILVILLCFTVFCFCQETRIHIDGKIAENNLDLTSIHIANKITHKLSISNTLGEFSILVKKGDTIKISAIHIKNFNYIITQKNIKDKRILLYIEAVSNNIKEVLIKNHTLTKNLTFDAKKTPIKDSLLIKNGALNFSVAYNFNKPMKPDKLSKDKAVTKRLANTDPIVDGVDVLGGGELLIGLFTNKDKQKQRAYNKRKLELKNAKINNLNKDNNVETKLVYLFGKDFFTKQLAIPQLKITDFIEFCQDKTNLASLIVNKKEIKLIELLINESKNYKQRLIKE